MSTSFICHFGKLKWKKYFNTKSSDSPVWCPLSQVWGLRCCVPHRVSAEGPAVSPLCPQRAPPQEAVLLLVPRRRQPRLHPPAVPRHLRLTVLKHSQSGGWGTQRWTKCLLLWSVCFSRTDSVTELRVWCTVRLDFNNRSSTSLQRAGRKPSEELLHHASHEMTHVKVIVHHLHPFHLFLILNTGGNLETLVRWVILTLPAQFRWWKDKSMGRKVNNKISNYFWKSQNTCSRLSPLMWRFLLVFDQIS